MKTRYGLNLASKTHCPECHHAVMVLATDSLDKPAFYICFDCGHVAEVGVGPVSGDQTAESKITADYKFRVEWSTLTVQDGHGWAEFSHLEDCLRHVRDILEVAASPVTIKIRRLP